jgi:microcystin-dependent protein
MSTSISFDNIEILKFDSTKSKSAVPLEYIDGLFDSKNMFFQNGKVGFGNSSPVENVDISGGLQANFVKTNGLTIWNPINTSAQDAFLNIRVAGSNGGNPYLSFNVENESGAQWSFGIDNSDNKFRWKNTQNFSGLTRMILDQQGFLGLGGVENPSAEITLPNTNKNKKIVLYDVNNNNHQFSGLGSSNTEMRYQVSGSGVDHIFYSAVNNLSSKELFRIKGNGRIGVGTNNPLSKTHISIEPSEDMEMWGIQLETQNVGSKGSGILLTNNGIGGRSFGVLSAEQGKLNFIDFASPSTTFLSLDRTGGLELKNNTRTHLLVDGSGNIGIGTTQPTNQLHVFSPQTATLALESSSVLNGIDAKITVTQRGATGINCPRVNWVSGLSGSNEVSMSLSKTGDFSLGQLKINDAVVPDASQNKLTITKEGNVEVAQNLSVRGRIQENGNDLLPVGTILPYAGNLPPGGFVFCDGTSYSSTNVLYQRLFGVIGTTYGGNAINKTFQVPDLRCRFPLGSGTNVNDTNLYNGTTLQTSTKNLATKGGKETHQLTINEMPSHNHDGKTTPLKLRHVAKKPVKEYGSNGRGHVGPWDGTERFRDEVYDFLISSQGGNQFHATMPPYLVINYIIKI